MKLAIAALVVAVAGIVVPRDAGATDRPVHAMATSPTAQLATTTITPAEAMALGEQAIGIGPGSNLVITSDADPYVVGHCTANFIWEAVETDALYLGAAGHCFVPTDYVATHGADADYDPRYSHVEVCVAECTNGGYSGIAFSGTVVDLGPVAYARQHPPAGAAAEDVGNDFGIVEIPVELHALVRRSMPVFGGATIADAELGAGDITCHYGNGAVLGEAYPTMGRVGVGLFEDDLGYPGAWFAAAPVAPGDSGAAFQTCRRAETGLVGDAAIGVVTHITDHGIAGTTIERAIEMAEEAGLTLSPQLGD